MCTRRSHLWRRPSTSKFFCNLVERHIPLVAFNLMLTRRQDSARAPRFFSSVHGEGRSSSSDRDAHDGRVHGGVADEISEFMEMATSPVRSFLQDKGAIEVRRVRAMSSAT